MRLSHVAAGREHMKTKVLEPLSDTKIAHSFELHDGTFFVWSDIKKDNTVDIDIYTDRSKSKVLRMQRNFKIKDKNKSFMEIYMMVTTFINSRNDRMERTIRVSLADDEKPIGDWTYLPTPELLYELVKNIPGEMDKLHTGYFTDTETEMQTVLNYLNMGDSTGITDAMKEQITKAIDDMEDTKTLNGSQLPRPTASALEVGACNCPVV